MDAPPIQYARTSDGVRIAYSVSGVGDGLPVVMLYAIPGGDAVSGSGAWANMAAEIGSDRRVARYTRRGVGSSQRAVEDVDIEHLALDVDAIADKLGFEQFAFWSISSGALVALHYAATRPGRVAALVMDSPAAMYSEAGRALRVLVDSKIDWVLVSELFPVVVIGRADIPNSALNLPAFFRQSHNREDLSRQLKAIDDLDLRPLLSTVSAKALITVSDVAERQHGVEGAQDVAAGIPDARLVSIETQWDTAAGLEFLRNLGKPNTTPPPGTRAAESSAFRAILFTDLASHTEMMDRLGDDAGREVLREHERITRTALGEHGGTEVKTLGDGFMASFSSASQSLRCAQALQHAFESPLESGYRLSVRIGINAGEPIEEEEDLFGTSVIVAARTAASAGGGQIVVTDVVRQLVAGKEFLFADRGLSALKGFEDPVHTWEVLW
jgi:class 3 adenylate cyclase